MTDQPPYGVGTYIPPNSSMALVSLITGILGLTIFPVIGSFVALITGSMAKKEIANSRGALSGEGLAKAGIILGWVGIGLPVCVLCIAAITILFVILLPMLLVAPWIAQEFGMLLLALI